MYNQFCAVLVKMFRVRAGRTEVTSVFYSIHGSKASACSSKQNQLSGCVLEQMSTQEGLPHCVYVGVFMCLLYMFYST